MKKLSVLSVSVWAVSLSACTLEIPNVPICADKGRLGAVCANTIGDEDRRQVNKLAWDKMRVGWFCMNAKALGDYKTFVEKACQQDKKCVEGVRRILELSEKAPEGGASIQGGKDEVYHARSRY